jgi:hypothetical protein
MLNITVSGDQAASATLKALSGKLPKALDRGLIRIAQGVQSDAVDWLSGPGRSRMKLNQKNGRRNLRGQIDSLGARPGSYPVPVITGHLRRMQNWLRPGASKSGEAGVFSAGRHEVVVYNPAAYAYAIHNSKGSSRRYRINPHRTQDIPSAHLSAIFVANQTVGCVFLEFV